MIWKAAAVFYQGTDKNCQSSKLPDQTSGGGCDRPVSCSVSRRVVLELHPPPIDQEALIRLLVAHESCFVPSHVAVHQGRDVKREVHGNHRNSLSLGINDQLRPIVSALYETIFPQIPQITAALDLKSFVVGYHDAACIAFGDGAFFAKHIDRYRRFSADRVLSWVYYISKTPTPFTGGDLVFYRGQSEIERITPEPRKLIVFRSDVQHEVERVMCPSKSFADCRFAITGFLHARPTLLRRGLDAARYTLYPFRSATPMRAAARLVRRVLRS